MIIGAGIRASRNHQKSKERKSHSPDPSAYRPNDLNSPPPQYGQPQTSLDHSAGQNYLSPQPSSVYSQPGQGQGYGIDPQQNGVSHKREGSVSPVQYNMVVSEEERQMILEYRRR